MLLPGTVVDLSHDSLGLFFKAPDFSIWSSVYLSVIGSCKGRLLGVVVTLGQFAEGRTLIPEGTHGLEWQDHLLEPWQEEGGVGWLVEGGAKNSFCWVVEGADILGNLCQLSAGILVSFIFFPREFKKENFLHSWGERGSVFQLLAGHFCDNVLGVPPLFLAGSGFVSISARPELIELDLVPTVLRGSSSRSLLWSCAGRICFLPALLKLHGLSEWIFSRCALHQKWARTKPSSR